MKKERLTAESPDIIDAPPGGVEPRLVTRCISLPVQECVSMPKDDFLRLLRSCWHESTDLANWASQTLRRHDVVRVPTMHRLPPVAPVDLYALAFGRDKPGRSRTAGKPPLPVVVAEYGGDFWKGAKIAAASLLRGVQRKYFKERGKVVWRRERRTPEFLYPYPFPVHQQSWVPFYDERNRPVVNLALPGGRVALRLRGGAEFVRQLKVFHQLVDGEIGQQELKICRQRTHADTFGMVFRERAPGGGHLETYRIMLRISVRVPAWSVGEVSGIVAEVRTGRDPFLTLIIPGQEPFVRHAPEVRQWIESHRRFLDRFADDLKYEKRWPRGVRRRMNRRQTRGCDKNGRRMQTFNQQLAAQFVGHAHRRHVERIRWDDTDRSFAESYPWHQLKEAMQHKCDEYGIVLESVSGSRGEVVEVSCSGESDPNA